MLVCSGCARWWWDALGVAVRRVVIHGVGQWEWWIAMELGKLGGRSGWSDVCQAKGAGGGGGGGGVGWWRIALESWSRGICRYKYSWAVKLLLACCAALFLLSPALSRRLPSATNGMFALQRLLLWLTAIDNHNYASEK